MLLLKTDTSFRDILNGTSAPIAVLQASRPDIPDAANVQRANDLAVAAKIEGFGVMVIEGPSDARTAREIFVLVVGNVSQLVGFARKILNEAGSTADWFLFRRQNGDLVRENADRSRGVCLLDNKGFTLPNGRTFQFGRTFIPASFNTALGYSGGADVGEFLKSI
jgi:hypothetical protein